MERGCWSGTLNLRNSGEAAKYTAQLSGGIQKPQERPDALRPGRFVVSGAFDPLVVHLHVVTPAARKQDVAIPFHVFNNARPFPRADIEPDTRPGVYRRVFGEFVNHSLVPPYGRRSRCNFS